MQLESLFEAYTETDHLIAKDISRLNAYLIGGTAIDVWCEYFGLKKARHRSNNDLDFYTQYSNKQLKNIEVYLKNMGFDIEVSDQAQLVTSNKSLGIEVDVLIDRANESPKMFSHIKYLNVMHPVFLFKSKFSRYVITSGNRKNTDEIDLLQLLSIINKMNDVDLLEIELSKMNFGTKEEFMLNQLITKFNENSK